MGGHFPAVGLDNVVCFSTLFMMSGFLWHSSKWARRFNCSLQYTSGIEVLAYSFNTNLNYVTTMLQLHPFSNCTLTWITKFLVAFSKVDTTQLQQCYLLNSKSSAQFSSKVRKFLRSLTEYLAVLAFLYCHYIFDSYIICLTLSFNTLSVHFHSH